MSSARARPCSTRSASEGGEGIISKKADGALLAARATRNWLKVKCIQRQEFVIVGWSESDKRRGFRSLLLAAREGGKLTYAGKVGTGFNTKMIEEPDASGCSRSRSTSRRSRCRAPTRKGAHWIEAQAGRRDRLHRVHHRRHPAPPELHRAARGQAGEGGGPRNAAASCKKAEKKAEQRDRRELRHQDQQPRPRDLSRATA